MLSFRYQGLQECVFLPPFFLIPLSGLPSRKRSVRFISKGS